MRIEHFPSHLHYLLSLADWEEFAHIASWRSHGLAFCIHDKKKFMSELMPKMFRQSKWSSFQRQLNKYGFTRMKKGPDAGSYYHRYFLREYPSLCNKIICICVKGTKCRVKDKSEDPNFYDKAKRPFAPGEKYAISNTNIQALYPGWANRVLSSSFSRLEEHAISNANIEVSHPGRANQVLSSSFSGLDDCLDSSSSSCISFPSSSSKSSQCPRIESPSAFLSSQQKSVDQDFEVSDDELREFLKFIFGSQRTIL